MVNECQFDGSLLDRCVTSNRILLLVNASERLEASRFMREVASEFVQRLSTSQITSVPAQKRRSHGHVDQVELRFEFSPWRAHHTAIQLTVPESIEARLSPESTALHRAIGLFVSEEVTRGQAAEIARLPQSCSFATEQLVQQQIASALDHGEDRVT